MALQNAHRYTLFPSSSPGPPEGGLKSAFISLLSLAECMVGFFIVITSVASLNTGLAPLFEENDPGDLCDPYEPGESLGGSNNLKVEGPKALDINSICSYKYLRKSSTFTFLMFSHLIFSVILFQACWSMNGRLFLTIS